MDKQEAIKILKEVHDTSALFSVRTALETVFPELKESEDERIRKAVIEMIHDTPNIECEENKVFSKYDVDLIEKQGEKKTNNQSNFELPFGAKDSELIEESYYIPKGYHAEISKDKVTIKKGEQRPVWSEEDDGMLETVEGWLDTLCEYLKDSSSEYIPHVESCINWLKSLK